MTIPRKGSAGGLRLIVKLRYLNDWSPGRRANAARYDELFAGETLALPIYREQSDERIYYVADIVKEFLARWSFRTQLGIDPYGR